MRKSARKETKEGEIKKMERVRERKRKMERGRERKRKRER
jgi:hypothetical protein